ncbi:hypothetical protein LSH36_183g01072 [Paralvinella palmiformis]|uniref:Uncharacterized protein n=1 Tax=Paralvinella palmiformis TaxID=53620 RepID=A0AAD9JRL6_9ANNE|nr:hypothetical protein LSH36_183g01072 [Paralvinella palmiformis]
MLRVVVGCQISSSSITNCILINDIMTVQEDSCQQNEIQQSEKKTSDHQSSCIHTDVDGLYAWIIAMTSLFGHLMVYGVLYSSGVFYEMFREIFDGSSSVFSLIASLSTAFTLGFNFIGVEIFPSAYGYLLVFEGVGCLCGPSASGWLFDALQRYPPSFYIGGATIGAAGVMIFIPHIACSPNYQITLDIETERKLKDLSDELLT